MDIRRSDQFYFGINIGCNNPSSYHRIFLEEVEAAPRLFAAQIYIRLAHFGWSHVWHLTLAKGKVQLQGATGKASATIEKRLGNYDKNSRSLFNDRFIYEQKRMAGLDGLDVNFEIRSSWAHCSATIWCPSPEDYPNFHSLLRFCWSELHGVNAAYDEQLEKLPNEWQTKAPLTFRQ